MYRAEISLVFFKIAGIWSPTSSRGIFTPYNAFSIFIISLMTLFTTSNLLYIFVEDMDMEEFTDNLFYFLALFLGCLKMAVVFKNQDEITELTDVLLNKQFSPRNAEEICIQSAFDTTGRTGTIAYAAMVAIAVTGRTAIPLLRGDLTSLPYGGWIPYNIDNGTIFWLTFVFQSLGAIIASNVVVATDTFIIVMLLQLCAQIEMLIHRMKMFPKLYKTELLNHSEKQQTFLVNWIQHHESLYHFRNKLNDLFGLVFFCQLFVTTLEVCTGTYLLATFSVTSVKFWSMMVSLTFIMTEIFIFCWHGNLVTEKSKEIGYAVFGTDWTSLSSKSRKSLIYIIERSNIPIQLYAGPVVPLSINTFTHILRVAYSIYNCLMRQQGTEL